MWRSVVVQKENTLLIEDVQEEDGGNYTCELKFEGKLIRRTTELKVTGKFCNLPVSKLPAWIRKTMLTKKIDGVSYCFLIYCSLCARLAALRGQ